MLALGLFLHSSVALAAPLANETITIPKSTYNQLVQQIQDLLTSNKSLQEKVQELYLIQKSTPKLSFNDPITVIIDKQGNVFIKDTLVGSLELEKLKYDVSLKLKTSILRAPSDKQESLLDFKWKAALLQSYEPVDTRTISFVSYALGFEPIHYKQFSANAFIGNRLYGAALGVDVTEHMDVLVGIGLRYNDQKGFTVGLAFDL